jgi:transcriptional regulator with XRE-family HTH domain
MSFQVFDPDLLEKFREDVRMLRLRLPIAEIANRMGMDKGNISSYLNGRKRPGKKFLQKFYQIFSASTTTVAEAEIPYTTRDGIYKMQEEIQQMKTAYSISLQAMEEKLSRVLLTIEDMVTQLRMMDKLPKKENKQSVRKKNIAPAKKISPRKSQ